MNRVIHCCNIDSFFLVILELFELMKKTNISVILSVAIIGMFLASMPTNVTAAPSAAADPEPVIYGNAGTSMFDTIDPHNAWDSASNDVIEQVAEGLFAYDLADPKLPVVPRLAAGMPTWSDDGLELTVPLREGVTFHDGTAFNATAVKWSFDRLMAFVDAEEVVVVELYQPLAAENPATPNVINKTEVIDTYKVKFTLNYAFAAFIPLLCYTSSYILSPTSTPADTLLEADDTLVGTGPFKYGELTATQLTFTAYEDYYRGPAAIKEMVWVLYADTNTVNQALLSGDIDYPTTSLPDFYDEFDAAEGITLEGQMQSTGTSYLGMNNKVINKTYRHAISYAINYDYIISEILDGYAIRMKSPIPDGIAMAVTDLDYATYDKVKARQILIDAGLVSGLAADAADADWEALADGDSPAGEFNYTYNSESSIRQDYATLIEDNLAKIGIKVQLFDVGWIPFLIKAFYTPWELELYLLGWLPDYNDPSNFINPLFSNTSASNGCQVNDPWLQEKMAAGLKETDPVKRAQIYYDIQKYLVEDLMPWAYLTQSTGRLAHNKDLTNMTRNAMGTLQFYPMSWMGVNTNITDPYADVIVVPGGNPLDDITDDGTGSGAAIDGFDYLVLLGVAACTTGIIYKKHRK